MNIFIIPCDSFHQNLLCFPLFVFSSTHFLLMARLIHCLVIILAPTSSTQLLQVVSSRSCSSSVRMSPQMPSSLQTATTLLQPCWPYRSVGVGGGAGQTKVVLVKLCGSVIVSMLCLLFMIIIIIIMGGVGAEP